ncbi:MAG: class I SAM-dependent methyltransferase [Phycisphaerales bacterium]|nr:class I SAM-dependent methyltransferase [Phycisphaerales bacterium]MCB9864877.1 class I SAM-dependent methyltransferase [Phycisphaerales bacterium]
MTTNVARALTTAATRPKPKLEVALPEPGLSMQQNREWCVVRTGPEEWRRIGFHDYDELFSIPGLYEKVIYDILQCNSPNVVVDLLDKALKDAGESMRNLRAIDLGAGNGIVGELLAERGTGYLVAVDIIKEAKLATKRDRPDVYESYHVVDLTNLSPEEKRQLAACSFNCMICVAALGFGDIPTEAFTNAFNLVNDDGWIAFNIKEEFLGRQDASGFSELINKVIADGTLDIRMRQRYQHRLATDREPIYYVAFAGRKRADIH